MDEIRIAKMITWAKPGGKIKNEEEDLEKKWGGGDAEHQKQTNYTQPFIYLTFEL